MDEIATESTRLRDLIEKLIDATVEDTQFVYSEKLELVKEISEYFKARFEYRLYAVRLEDKPTCKKCKGTGVYVDWNANETKCDCKQAEKPQMMVCEHAEKCTMRACSDRYPHKHDDSCDTTCKVCLSAKCVPVEDSKVICKICGGKGWNEVDIGEYKICTCELQAKDSKAGEIEKWVDVHATGDASDMEVFADAINRIGRAVKEIKQGRGG